MTLQEKLKMRRNLGQNVKPIHTAKGIWQYMRMEFETFSSIELPMGESVCIEVEKVRDGLQLKKYILESNLEKNNLQAAWLPLDKDCLENLEREMDKVSEMAKQAGCQIILVEDDDYIAWGVEVSLI